jgi:predicted YcjX-like family ATPase
MSHTAFKEKVKPVLEKDKVLLLMVDNLRYDQWKVVEPLFQNFTTKFQKIIISVFCLQLHNTPEILFCRFDAFGNRKTFPRQMV